MDEGTKRGTAGGDAERLTIGEFAQRTRLTAKALRLYDEMGLLAPDHVDPYSGYRYYRAGQVAEARLVAVLRGVDMPLAEIAEFLAAPSAGRLARWWHGEAQGFAERRALVHYLKETLEGRGAHMFDVATREVPEEKVATLSRRVLQPELNDFIPEAIGTLRRHIESQGAEAKEFDFVIYHSMITADSEGLVEVCVPFTGSIEPVDEIGVRIEPAHHEAYTRITKGQVKVPEIMHAYDAVGGWLEQHRKEMTASPREVYFADWVAVTDDDDALDIAYPFAP